MPLQDLLLDQDTVLDVSSISMSSYGHKKWLLQVVQKLYKKQADFFTKPLEAQRMLMPLSRRGYNFVEGRHQAK